MNYLVIVGNIGTVYDGEDEQQARNEFQEYLSLSSTNYGRAAGEDVTLMLDGEPIEEYSEEYKD